MNNLHDVTVLIPTFNRAKLLKRAIISVLLQKYENIIIVVCDNASSDETQMVVNELSGGCKIIKYIRHPKNIGALENFKFAFSQVKTSYFSILSDDDCLAEDFIYDSIQVLKEYENIGFVIQNSLFVNNELISNQNILDSLDISNDKNADLKI